LTHAARPLQWAFLLACFCLCSCGTYEDKRIRELLQEKGFGSRAQGVATRENYVGGRDRVQFLMPPDLPLQAGVERLAELAVPQPIAIDGTIFVPYVGPVDVLGKTEAEVTALVKAQLRAAGLMADLDIQARIVVSEKWIYAVGEVGRKGPVAMDTDLTFFDAMFTVGWTPLANLGRVYLIRPDAEHPLVVDINFRELVTTGLMQRNIALQERDIIYVPPTFLGLLARLLERLLTPLSLAVQSVFGLAQAQASYEVLSGERDFVYFRF
jgi:protein involved in polysaccharide export with SLBB domain